MNGRQSFVTEAQSAELMQPCDGAFNHPARRPQSAAMARAALGDLTLDALIFERVTNRLTVISPISLHTTGLAQRTATLADDGCDPGQQRQQLGDIVAIGFGQNHIHRKALRVDEEVMFAAGLAAIGWVRSRFFPRGRHAPRNCRQSDG